MDFKVSGTANPLTKMLALIISGLAELCPLLSITSLFFAVFVMRLRVMCNQLK